MSKSFFRLEKVSSFRLRIRSFLFAIWISFLSKSECVITDVLISARFSAEVDPSVIYLGGDPATLLTEGLPMPFGIVGAVFAVKAKFHGLSAAVAGVFSDSLPKTIEDEFSAHAITSWASWIVTITRGWSL